MKLHILRHAKPDSYSESDKEIDRKLLPEGISQAKALRGYFNSIENIETVWCSDAVRTRKTAEIAIGDNHPAPDFKLDLYLASKETILQHLWKLKSDGDLLIIGHNFGISDLINYFTDDDILLDTAEYVCIEFNCTTWSETTVGSGTIVDRYRP